MPRHIKGMDTLFMLQRTKKIFNKKACIFPEGL